MATSTSDEGPPDADSYLDYTSLTHPSFSPTAFANDLILATNNATDTPLDLTTPLSRVLFDIQDLDTRLDRLTSTSSLHLLHHTRDNVAAGETILAVLEEQLAALKGSYDRLDREVGARWSDADTTRTVACRVWETVRVGRSVSRVLVLGRTLEAQVGELQRVSGAHVGAREREDHSVLLRAANTILAIQGLLRSDDADALRAITVVQTLRDVVVDPAERTVVARAEQVVAQFSLSNLTAQTVGPQDSGSSSTAGQTYAQMEDTRARATSALLALYLLSPVSEAPQQQTKTPTAFDPTLLTQTLQDYLRRAITSSLAGLASALSALPKLDRTLLEVSARCQNIVALEALLRGIRAPPHPLLAAAPSESDGDGVSNGVNHSNGVSVSDTDSDTTLLTPLLQSLDTASLPSYFWRSMASQLSARVAKILRDGGVSARTLRSNRERVAQAVRACVVRGSSLPGGVGGSGGGAAATGAAGAGGVAVGGWEREAAVMVGAVVNVLGR